MKITPKDTVDALRLLAKHKLVEKSDPTEVKEAVAGMATAYLAQRREGKTDLEFTEWFETADVTALMDEEDEDASDPTE